MKVTGEVETIQVFNRTSPIIIGVNVSLRKIMVGNVIFDYDSGEEIGTIDLIELNKTGVKEANLGDTVIIKIDPKKSSFRLSRSPLRMIALEL